MSTHWYFRCDRCEEETEGIGNHVETIINVVLLHPQFRQFDQGLAFPSH